MKRVVLSNVNSATNSCGILTAPAVSEVIEPSEISLLEENNEMKRVLGSKDTISRELAIQIIKKASQALHLVLNLPDDIEGLNVYDYLGRSDFSDIADVQEKLMWTYLDMEKNSK